jgi:hypothetical protein
MGHVVLPGCTCRALAAEMCAVRDVVVRPRLEGPACAGVRGGVGRVVGLGVPLETAPQTDPAVRLTSQVSGRTGMACENATNPCRGFPEGATGIHPGSRGRWTP